MLDVLSKIEARGALEIAARVKQRCSSIFDFAITKLLTTSNPTHPLRDSFQTPKNKNYARLKIEEMPEFMQKLAAYDGRKQTALAIRFMAYTFVRTGELRGAEWPEFDLDAAQWRIPAERMKMKEEHIVPLSRQAIEVLRELQKFVGEGRLVFPGDRGPNKPKTITKADVERRIRKEMTKHPECESVTLLEIYWHYHDETGCNWDVNWWGGPPASKQLCIASIAGAARDLRAKYKIFDPE